MNLCIQFISNQFTLVPLTKFLKVFVYRKSQMRCGFAEPLQCPTFELI